MTGPHGRQAPPRMRPSPYSHAIAKVPAQFPAAVTPTPVPSRDAPHGFSRSLAHELRAQLKKAAAQGATKVVVTSGELCRLLGGYPGSTHGMPACCNAMRAEMKPGDNLLVEQPNGGGMTVRYLLPCPQ
jgi:hypothetical protein